MQTPMDTPHTYMNICTQPSCYLGGDKVVCFATSEDHKMRQGLHLVKYLGVNEDPSLESQDIDKILIW